MMVIRNLVIVAAMLAAFQIAAFETHGDDKKSRIVRGVQAEGACAVVGMSAEQSQLLALQRARSAAIEQAAGLEISSATLVTDSALSARFIQSYARGYIIEEDRHWLPLGQYQKDPASPPIAEYRVNIVANVYVPARKNKHVGLTIQPNASVFREGETFEIEIRTEKAAKIAIFNFRADDKVQLVYPNRYDRDNIVPGGQTRLFPPEFSMGEIVVRPLEGHLRDAEAIMVVAVNATSSLDFLDVFNLDRNMSHNEFFKKFMEIADDCESDMRAYEVFSRHY